MRTVVAVGTEQADRVLGDRDVEAVDVLACSQVVEEAFVSELVAVVFVGTDLYLQDLVFVGVVLDLQQLDKVSLHHQVLAHLALRQEVTRNRHRVVQIGL